MSIPPPPQPPAGVAAAPEPVRILGLSKTKSSQQLLSWEVYFDAVGGKLIQDRTKEDIFQALWWGLENRI